MLGRRHSYQTGEASKCLADDGFALIGGFRWRSDASQRTQCSARRETKGTRVASRKQAGGRTVPSSVGFLATMNVQRRNFSHPALTGVRGIAALAVAVYHLAYLNQPSDLPGYIFPGYLAVDLFFILSGFIMAMNYATALTGPGAGRSYRKFLTSRFARVYPVYAFLCLVSMALYITLGGRVYPAGTVILNMLLLQYWGLGLIKWQWGEVIFGPSWSISTEALCYVIAPIIFSLSIKRGKAFSIMLGLVCAISIVLVAAMSPGVRGPLDSNSGQTLWPMLRCLAGFTAGVLTWRFYKAGVGQRVRDAGAWFDWLWIFVFAALIAIHGSDVLVVFLFPALIIRLCARRSPTAHAMGGPVAFFFGEISFSLYLIQSDTTQLLQGPFTAFFARYSIDHPRAVASLLILGLDIIVATALFLLVEKPARKWLRELFDRRRVPPIELDPAAP